MTDDQSLGEILARALTSDSEPTTPPLGFGDQLLMLAIEAGEATRKAEQERQAAHSVYMAGCLLSDDLAPLLGKRSDEVFDVLGSMPNEMLSLLATPQGWSTLATYVAGRFDLPAPAYAPKLH